MPKNARFTEDFGRYRPSPQSYSNTNEVSNKMTLKRNGQFSIPKQARKVDFTKYSALHSNLVEKGYY